MAKKTGKKTGSKKPRVKVVKEAEAKAPATPAPRPKLPNAWKLTKAAWQILWKNRVLFLGVTIIYGLLSLILVQGIAGGTDVSGIKHDLNQAFTGSLGSLASGFSVFAVLVGSTGNSSSQTAGSYQLTLGIITSLAVIWALRQIMAGKRIRIRDAYYRGMAPLIPFILVIFVIGIQLIPFIIGSTLYSLVVTNGIAIGLLERLVFLLLFLAGISWSIYMVSASLFALYIVTLPDMTPLKAVRSARDLAKGRRWPIILRLIFLPVVLLVAAAIIMVPIIIVLTFLAQWVFFLLSMFTLVAVHAYLYTLYRELLNE
ncbi:MAG TPA: hypothetical protein VHA05_01000 [Candidatus Saccharimonadales bacterium]|nr:hypothetical protein [Candidatus Saccharimonadales bacterium]